MGSISSKRKYSPKSVVPTACAYSNSHSNSHAYFNSPPSKVSLKISTEKCNESLNDNSDSSVKKVTFNLDKNTLHTIPEEKKLSHDDYVSILLQLKMMYTYDTLNSVTYKYSFMETSDLRRLIRYTISNLSYSLNDSGNEFNIKEYNLILKLLNKSIIHKPKIQSVEKLSYLIKQELTSL